MSNISLKERIEHSIKEFKSGDIDIKGLKSSIEANGRSLEMMPYALVKEIDEIESRLTMAGFADEEDCETNIEEVLEYIEKWLEKVPTESNN